MLEQVKTANISLRAIYDSGEIYSQKISSFFGVYEELFSKYVGKPITFVEVGVSQGGSLFMWREYFGPQARIIGVELNPLAKKWEKDGFEIFIGDQGDPKFWEEFFAKVGKVDVLLDDGGHTNLQQVVTVAGAVSNVNDGGLILIEDVHTSYMKSFGNPSPYSFVNFAKSVVDTVNSRMDRLAPKLNSFFPLVYSVGFYESMVAFHIDSRKAIVSTTISNGGIQSGAEDMRIVQSYTAAEKFARGRFAGLQKLPAVRAIAKTFFVWLRSVKMKFAFWYDRQRLKKYFT